MRFNTPAMSHTQACASLGSPWPDLSCSSQDSRGDSFSGLALQGDERLDVPHCLGFIQSRDHRLWHPPGKEGVSTDTQQRFDTLRQQPKLGRKVMQKQDNLFFSLRQGFPPSPTKPQSGPQSEVEGQSKSPQPPGGSALSVERKQSK